METLIDLFSFFAKGLVIVLVFALLSAIIAFLVARSQMKAQVHVEVLNNKFRELLHFVRSQILQKADVKEFLKEFKEYKKTAHKRRLFVLDFDGDIKASHVESLREEVSLLLSLANTEDKVLIRLESAGGMVHSYGLAAAQLLRIRERKIPLVVAVDKMAASGGYMMAATATHLIAAPFAIIGSIGVVAQVPNLHKLLQKFDIDYKEYTAGEFKRTVSLLGEITPKGEEKFREQIEQTHILFKDFVHGLRPGLELEKVSTGEHWYGEQALKLHLIDEVRTSDDFILDHFSEWQVVRLEYVVKEKIRDKISHLLNQTLFQALFRLVNLLYKQEQMTK